VTEFLGIIPARYASTRFPGKPLAMLGEKPMIQWVYEGVSSMFEHLLVATDDERIYKEVLRFGGKAQMTSTLHKTGTERCAEAAGLYEQESGLCFEYVVNIQGDEPLIQLEQLQTLIDCVKDPEAVIATLIRPLAAREELENPNVVKVVVDQSFRAMYFSRASIPYVRDSGNEQNHMEHQFYTHIGLYVFRRKILEELVQFRPSVLEQSESLEQLRWLEHGVPIRTAVTHLTSIGVDTPEDLEKIRKLGDF
jgi:3-deoxy-manno-octulosonate cytidylyltransferase (CMP-KDO synthetase)